MRPLCASAAEGIAPPPLSRGARPCTREEGADAQKDAARNRTPLRAGVPERALLEGGDVLESSLLGLKPITTDVRLVLAP